MPCFNGIEVLNCPCCGSADLDIGPQTAQSFGVECRGCQLTMERGIPGRYPRGITSLEMLEEHVLIEAIAAWNERVPHDEYGPV